MKKSATLVVACVSLLFVVAEARTSMAANSDQQGAEKVEARLQAATTVLGEIVNIPVSRPLIETALLR